MPRRKVTGGSLSILGFGGGLDWEKGPTDEEIASALLNRLADRRVLFNQCAWEMPEHCVMSVLDIREGLTDLLERLPTDAAIAADLRELRAACRRFCDALRPLDSALLDLPPRRLDMWQMRDALGDLRDAFGPVLQRIIEHHKLTPEPELARLVADPRATL